MKGRRERATLAQLRQWMVKQFGKFEIEELWSSPSAPDRRSKGKTMTDTSPLTSRHVMDVFFRCLASAETDSVIIDGIVNRAAFAPKNIDTCRQEIRGMLAELPLKFRHEEGGGWTFLNACNDRHGRQWTGYHQVMEELFMLGLAAGMVESPFPREDWSLLPGGMPYYVVKIDD